MVESEVKSLAQLSEQRLDEAGPEARLWHDRRVVFTDGSTLSMPNFRPKKELGFPILRILVLITLGSGAVHLLAYNLLRALMARTAQMTGQTPREISLRTAQQTLRDVHMILLLNANDLGRIIEAMSGIMAEHRVGDRPDRIEPRAVKRRAKAYPKLQHSRAKARQLKGYQGKAA